MLKMKKVRDAQDSIRKMLLLLSSSNNNGNNNGNYEELKKKWEESVQFVDMMEEEEREERGGRGGIRGGIRRGIRGGRGGDSMTFGNGSGGASESLVDEMMLEVEKLNGIVKEEVIVSQAVRYNSCYLEIHSGAGGDDAKGFAWMLMRMYERWANQYHDVNRLIAKFPTMIDLKSKSTMSCTVEDVQSTSVGSSGDSTSAGNSIRSCVLKIQGGLSTAAMLLPESGIHRLVRMSNDKRHTSFASVTVYNFDQDNNHDSSNLAIIPEKDIKLEFKKSSGPGGQHVNKTESAVRLTHLPTGIVINSQAQRSQHQNRADALQRLKAVLKQREETRINDKRSLLFHQDASDVNFGGKYIRSYTLYPNKLCKDTQSGLERSDVLTVLDGDIDEFLLHNITFINSMPRQTTSTNDKIINTFKTNKHDDDDEQ